MLTLRYWSRRSGSAGAFNRVAHAALLGALALVLAACSDGNGGLSRADVDEIVRAEMAEVEPGVSRADMEEVVRAEVAAVEPGVSRADVEEVVQSALAGIPALEAGISHADLEAAVQAAVEALPEPEAGISHADLEAAVQAAVEALPEPEAGLSRAEAERAVSETLAELLDASLPAGSGPSLEEIRRIARSEVASIPPKSAPADYTKFFVDNAVNRYETDGLDATLAHYSRNESIDEQWYVFIADSDGQMIAHPDPGIIGQNLRGPVGTDLNGFNFGAEMLTVTESGRWVPYVYVNPVTGTLGDTATFELKLAWVVRHDGLIFGSGWYIDSEEFLPKLIIEAARHFSIGGLPAILEFFNDPEGISSGFIPTANYYNSTSNLDGFFSGFIAAPDGELLAHINPALIGTNIEDLLGPAVRRATPVGTWITAEDNPADAGGPPSMRIWMVDVDGTLIGGGWYNLRPN